MTRSCERVEGGGQGVCRRTALPLFFFCGRTWARRLTWTAAAFFFLWAHDSALAAFFRCARLVHWCARVPACAAVVFLLLLLVVLLLSLLVLLTLTLTLLVMLLLLFRALLPVYLLFARARAYTTFASCPPPPPPVLGPSDL